MPPGRHARIASRSACPRSVSERVACLTRSTACSAPCPWAASLPTASITASGPRRPAGAEPRARSPPAGQFLELLDDVGVLGEVDRVGGARLVERHLEAVVVL